MTRGELEASAKEATIASCEKASDVRGKLVAVREGDRHVCMRAAMG